MMKTIHNTKIIGIDHGYGNILEIFDRHQSQ